MVSEYLETPRGAHWLHTFSVLRNRVCRQPAGRAGPGCSFWDGVSSGCSAASLARCSRCSSSFCSFISRRS